MKKLSIIPILVFIFSAGAVFGQCFPHQCSECVASMPFAGNEEMALFVLPDGSGSPLNEAQIRYDGGLLDAHIELVVLDDFGTPIANYPKEDMWLASTNGGMVPCSGGTCADVDTDQNGLTTWANPLRGGGFDTGTCEVIVNGYNVLGGEAPFSLAFNSSDINGDGVVTLADVGLFSSIFFGVYDFSADFFADGVMSLADVGRMAMGVGTSCP